MAAKISKHVLVPEHKKISEKEKDELLKKYNVTAKELPVIFLTDPAIEGMKVSVGDIIKITRNSYTKKQAIFYRRVAHEQ